jgi:hypothetical protein
MRMNSIPSNRIVHLIDRAQRRPERARLDLDRAPAAPRGAVDLRDERLYRNVVRLHVLGPRAIYELLAELGAKRLLRTEIEALVAHYVARGPELVQAVGADQPLPLPPPRLVEP